MTRSRARFFPQPQPTILSDRTRKTKSNPIQAFQLSGVLATLCLLFPGQAHADPPFSDANWISMGGLPGANGPIYATVVDASGNLYIGGDFTTVGDVAANRIAKWNGSSWSALSSGINGTVHALAISGTELYAGGVFTVAGGSPANNTAKWDEGGWRALGSGINGTVYALAVQDTNLYAAGYFTMADGSVANNVAKWNGSSWSPLSSGVSGAVRALALSGTTLYAGGLFTTPGSSMTTTIVKWNGSSWSPFGWGIPIGSSKELYPLVYALAVSGTDLYAGGQFRIAAGSPGDYIVKWDGSTWRALGSEMNAPVLALAVSSSDLYASGQFTIAGGSPAGRIAKWDGSSWGTVGRGMNKSVLGVGGL